MVISLLQSSELRALATAPETLRQRQLQRVEAAGVKTVILDEIQKLPELLNEVHFMIERDKSLRFSLTGSSLRACQRVSGRPLVEAIFLSLGSFTKQWNRLNSYSTYSVAL